MRKGSIVLVPFPFTDLSGKKVRPAVVLHARAGGDDFIAAFISSVPKMFKAVHSIPLPASSANGLKAPSCIRVAKIATLQKSIVVGELGRVELLVQKRVDKMLKEILSL